MNSSLRKARIILLTALPFALALLALGPSDWIRSLGAWTHLFLAHRYALMVVLIVLLLVRLFMLETGSGRILGSLKHIDVRTLPLETDRAPDDAREWFPADSDRTLRDELRRIERQRDRSHIVRVWLATGGTIVGTAGYFEQFFRMLWPKARFEVRILLMDPESPMIAECGHEDWAAESRASMHRLEAIAGKYSTTKNVRLEWRTYECPPMIRAVVVDESMMLFGFMTWFKEREGMQLHHQRPSYIRFAREQPGAADFIDFVTNWFDHEWERDRGITKADRVS
jgi:uncharacterized membrane protein YedE/YeeE